MGHPSYRTCLAELNYFLALRISFLVLKRLFHVISRKQIRFLWPPQNLGDNRDCCWKCRPCAAYHWNGVLLQTETWIPIDLDERIILDKQENVISCEMAKPDPGWKEGF